MALTDEQLTTVTRARAKLCVAQVRAIMSNADDQRYTALDFKLVEVMAGYMLAALGVVAAKKRHPWASGGGARGRSRQASGD